MKEIRIPVEPSENFTAASLMMRYAEQTPSVAFQRSLWGNAERIIEGRRYQYHHWGLNSKDAVHLYLLELNTAQELNKMCHICTRLDRDCKGSDFQGWTGCTMQMKRR